MSIILHLLLAPIVTMVWGFFLFPSQSGRHVGKFLLVMRAALQDHT